MSLLVPRLTWGQALMLLLPPKSPCPPGTVYLLAGTNPVGGTDTYPTTSEPPPSCPLSLETERGLPP